MSYSLLMEDSIALETDTSSLANQFVSSTVGANANINFKEQRPRKRKSYKPLCLALLDRCNAIQKDNERLVNRIHQVFKQLRRSRVERKFIMDRLVKHGANWSEVELQIDLGTELPSIEVDNLKIQGTPETPNENEDSILSKILTDPFFKFFLVN